MMTKDKIHTLMNAVIKVREILTDEQALKIKDIYPEWKPEVQYVTGERVLYNNVLDVDKRNELAIVPLEGYINSIMNSSNIEEFVANSLVIERELGLDIFTRKVVDNDFLWSLYLTNISSKKYNLMSFSKTDIHLGQSSKRGILSSFFIPNSIALERL